MNGQWQPIETAPRDGTHIIAITSRHVLLPGGRQPFANGKVRETHWDVSQQRFDYGCEIQPTHWMPLPELPPKDTP